MHTILTIAELAKALEKHPINAADMRGDYTYHIAGLNAEIGKISKLTSKRLPMTSEESAALGTSIGTCLLLLASIANTESLDLSEILTQALKTL